MKHAHKHTHKNIHNQNSNHKLNSKNPTETYKVYTNTSTNSQLVAYTQINRYTGAGECVLKSSYIQACRYIGKLINTPLCKTITIYQI